MQRSFLITFLFELISCTHTHFSLPNVLTVLQIYQEMIISECVDGVDNTETNKK